MKKLFTLFAVATLAFAAQAATLTVAEGAETNGHFPMYGLYCDTEGTISQMIYPAEMLVDMVDKQITEIKFYASSEIATNLEGCVMNFGLKIVEENEFPTSAVYDLGGIVNGTASPIPGETEFVLTLNEPFLYEGGNLLIGTEVIVTSSWKGTYFYGIETGLYCSCYEYTTSYGSTPCYREAFLPMATFTYEDNEEPETHEAPVISWVAEDGVLIVTATGDGFIMMEVGDEGITRTGEDEATYTTTYDPEMGITLEVRACIWENGEAVSEYAEATIEVGPVGPEPENPYAEGLWLVQVNSDGELIYTQLFLGQNGDYINVDDVTYPEFYDICGFYFLIDGVAYGAPEDMTEANLGNADENPLTEGDNLYYVGVGYSYTFGIHFIYDQDTMEFMGYSAYVAKGGRVDVAELNAGKTVAGVRYYNVAGQEMAQPAGLTIVVTTYTDGTTSAAKVMK